MSLIVGSILIIVGMFGLFFLFDLYKMRAIFTSSFLQNESARFFNDNSQAPNDYTSEGRTYTKGMAIIKDKETNKLKIITQAKPCDIGLY